MSGPEQPTLLDLAAEDTGAYRVDPAVSLAAAGALERAEHALVKWVTPNDAGTTGSHQAGFHLAVDTWPLFFDRPGQDGEQFDREVSVRWSGHGETSSRAVWYGRRSRSEYRLTRFGRGFPFRGEQHVGSLLVIAPTVDDDTFDAFVLTTDEEITGFLAATGLGGADVGGLVRRRPDPDLCLDREIEAFMAQHRDFPSTTVMAAAARRVSQRCLGTRAGRPDEAIVRWTEVEFRLFRALEDRDFTDRLREGPITDVTRLVELALPFMNRRKSRAGRSFEHHFAACLDAADLPYTAQATTEGTSTVDFVFPSEDAYADPSHPADRLVACGAKTSTRERWRQVLDEADRVDERFLLTLQPVPLSTIEQMAERGLQLVVPRPNQTDFGRAAAERLWSVDRFLGHVRDTVVTDAG